MIEPGKIEATVRWDGEEFVIDSDLLPPGEYFARVNKVYRPGPQIQAERARKYAEKLAKLLNKAEAEHIEFYLDSVESNVHMVCYSARINNEQITGPMFSVLRVDGSYLVGKPTEETDEQL